MCVLYKISLAVALLSSSLPAYAQLKPVAQNTDYSKAARARIVEDVPGPQNPVTGKLVRVAAQSTPSGFPVPRYVSLKYSSSNGRTGPSSAYPVAWHYTQRGLPLIVVAETEVWRKVRDFKGDETWMNKILLDGKKMVLARTEIILRAKPRSDSKKRAIAAKGALLQLQGCDEMGWCRIRDSEGRRAGYALQSLLWGAAPL